MIGEQSWSQFRTRLEDKSYAATNKSVVVCVSPVNTSRQCSACGYISKKNRENQAVFLCQSCGFEDNADFNAGRNILAAGLAVTGRVSGTSFCEDVTGAEQSSFGLVCGDSAMVGSMKRQPLVI